MKILIVGGRSQGKLLYACEAYGLAQSEFFTSGVDLPEKALNADKIYRLHMLVGGLLERNIHPLQWIQRYIQERPNWIILCDEVGCGVVPAEQSERVWREAVGRVCCELARHADVVERVNCGIPMFLKGGKQE